MNKNEIKLNKKYSKDNYKTNNNILPSHTFNFHNDYNIAQLWFDTDVFKEHKIYFAEDKFYKYIIVTNTICDRKPNEGFSQYLIPKFYSNESLYDLTYNLCTLWFKKGKNVMHEVFPNFIDYIDNKLWTLNGGINLADKEIFNYFYNEALSI